VPPPRGPSRRLLALLALAAAIAVAAAVVVLARDAGGGDEQRAETTGDATREATSEATAEPTARATEEPTADATQEPTAEATEEPTAAATPRSLSATATVRAFYERAAAGDFRGAWRLAGPGMRAVFGNSRAEFSRQLSSLQQIEFEELGVEQRTDGSATVRLRTVATHANRVDRCAGTLRAVRSGGRWLVEPAGLSCTPG
jgi:cytoskeletal protein RodZ